jgi:oxygen-independent coproporphyrinogen-3 oxidase
LISGLAKRLDLSGVQEWTCECNPATVRESYGQDYLAMLRELGVNRLSFGAQSFAASDLTALDRRHVPEDVPASLTAARAAGFERLNIDLIYAVPGQTLESWQQTLERAIALQTEHLSCYGLTYESNTPIAVKKRLGLLRPAEEDLELQMFHHTRRRLAAVGLPAYEVSNYSRPGAECRHNLIYWQGDDYIALGPSGASHVQGHRWKNRPHLGEWEQAIDERRLAATDIEHLSADQRAGELAMLRLRLAQGLDFADFAARMGRDAREIFAEPITKLERLGLIEIDERSARLTEKGWDVADAIAGEFM